jgi:ATP-dependent Clp protease ATP-binding subunit ClpA
VAPKALESLGISLEGTREKVKETFGPAGKAPAGSPPFTPRTKKVLDLSLRESLQLGHNYVGTEHILLGLVREGEGVAAQVLVSLGADLSRVRQQVIQLLSGYQGPSGPPGQLHTCPTCRAGLAQHGVWSTLSLPSTEEGGAPRPFTVVSCRACGTALAVLRDDSNP